MLKGNRVKLLLLAISYLCGGAYAVDCVKRPRVRYPYCLDKFDAREGHTLCLGGIHQRLMNDTARHLLTDLHNDLRSSVYPPAADMMLMKKLGHADKNVILHVHVPKYGYRHLYCAKYGLQYNQVLEKEAQIWAEQCKFTHDRPDLRFVAGRFAVGQNLAKLSVYNWTSVFEQWKSKNVSFTYGGTNNASAVKEITQMITAETSLLGCGVSKCGTDYFYVCNYAPVLNQNKVDKPYTQSKSGQWCDSCTKTCDNVTSHMCDCFGKFCINGGKLDLQTCSCNCVKDVKTYDHEHCELKCEKGGDDKGLCGKPPYERSTCRNNPDTAFHCPWMCDICPYAGMNYSSEGIALLPWEKGLPNCTSTTLTHPMTHLHSNGKTTYSVTQTTPTSSQNGTQFGTNRNGGSTLNNIALRINAIFATIYFTAKGF